MPNHSPPITPLNHDGTLAGFGSAAESRLRRSQKRPANGQEAMAATASGMEPNAKSHVYTVAQLSIPRDPCDGTSCTTTSARAIT